MDREKMAQGMGFRLMLAAMGMALAVNAIFAVTLSKASTNGQRIYKAWVESGDSMYAEAGVAYRKCNMRT